MLDEYMELWARKHNDYGPENHGIWGSQGVIIRLCDKLMRLQGHHFEGREMKTDSVEDAWLDIIGYGLIGLVVERGKWPRTTLDRIRWKLMQLYFYAIDFLGRAANE